MKTVDLFIGIKAEQNLREAVRLYGESLSGEEKEIELCPVGRKDWIAGMRFEGPLTQKQIEPAMKTALRKLIDLGSQQRIRSESMRVYSVQPPVPVFKDVEAEPKPPQEEAEPKPQSQPQSDEPVTCPACGRRVHPYNARFNQHNQVVGCSFCGGGV